MKTKDLVLIAMYVAMFTVLEYVSSSLGILQMPYGGSLSLSVLVLLMSSYHLGFTKSLLVCILSVGLKVLIKTPVFLSPVQFALDYFLAYSVYATAGLFKDFKKFPTGVLVANLLRYIVANVAGILFFASYYEGNVFLGVLGYNATYMSANLVFSIIAIALLKPALNKFIKAI